MSAPPKFVAFYGHHKCATSWIRRIIGEVCRMTGRKDATFDNATQFDGDLKARLERGDIDFLCYTNAQWEQVERLGPHPAFHIVRDPRDVLVSAYFSHRNSHQTEGWPELIPHREKLQKLGKEDGLIAEMDFSANVFADMAAWDFDQPHILEIRYEDLVRDNYGCMQDCFDHLGLLNDAEPDLGARLQECGIELAVRAASKLRLPSFQKQRQIPAFRLLEIVQGQRFDRITGGRKTGSEDPQSHYRKGQPGDWKLHFNKHVCKAFKKKQPALLRKLNYE